MVPYTVWVSAFCGVSEKKKKASAGSEVVLVDRGVESRADESDSAAVVG